MVTWVKRKQWRRARKDLETGTGNTLTSDAHAKLWFFLISLASRFMTQTGTNVFLETGMSIIREAGKKSQMLANRPVIRHARHYFFVQPSNARTR